jgi:NADH:ubiquinone oxidoreductase subunit 2 (subunit N)
MMIETIKLNEMGVFPELFLGICIIYLFFYGTFTCYNNRFNFPIIQTSISYLAVLTLVMVNYLLINDGLNELNYICFNSTISSDFLSVGSKLIISISSITFLLMVQEHFLHQKINRFEYILIFLFALLGIFLLCSSNDLITAYLSIELQSLAFYILAAFKKNSTYSIEAGLKYFILGAFSSGLFLFGSSLIYGLSGSVTFADFKDLFFWAVPGYTAVTLQSLSPFDRFELITSKILLIGIDRFSLSEYDCETLISEFDNLHIYNTEVGPFSFVRPYLYDLFIRTDLYNELYLCLDFGFLSQLNTPIFYERGLRALQNPDVFNYYGLLFPNLARLSLVEAQSKLLLTAEEYLKFDTYPSNFHMILERIPFFFEPDDYQTKNYFYGYKPFDISLLQFALTFILISLFFKLALAPFHTWSPAIYEGSPTSTTFFFVVVPKLGVFVLLLRIFYFGFYGFIDSWRYYVILVAIASVIVGSVAGLEQRKLKSLLAYSSISHMGYLLVSFTTGSLEGVQMLFNYLIIYMISGLSVWSVFVLTRLKNNYTRKQNKDLGALILLHKSNQVLALVLATSLFSIAGLPPTIGFLVKMSIFLSALESSMYFVALISILFSVISTFYYIRIVKILYFEPLLVGKLYYPITTQKAFILIGLFYLFFFFFFNPTALYLLSYKISLML